jgi:hypothetical protein
MGPFVGLWYLAVVIVMFRSFGWTRAGVASSARGASPNV